MRKSSAYGLAVLLGLAACTMGSGPPYRVQTSSGSGITILTDPTLRNLGQVQSVAQAHCASFGKQAVQTATSTKLQKGRTAVFFACR